MSTGQVNVCLYVVQLIEFRLCMLYTKLQCFNVSTQFSSRYTMNTVYYSFGHCRYIIVIVNLFHNVLNLILTITLHVDTITLSQRNQLFLYFGHQVFTQICQLFNFIYLKSQNVSSVIQKELNTCIHLPHLTLSYSLYLAIPIFTKVR